MSGPASPRGSGRACVLGLCVAATLASCAFSDGDPWARVDVTLTARLDIPDARRDGDRIKTARNYAVTIDRFEVAVSAVTVEQVAGGADSVFDPSDPPPGYTLCHNGHCHGDSGALVPYEEIAASLGGTTAPIEVAIGVTETPQDVLTTATFTVGPCDGSCDLPSQGSLSGLSVDLASVELQGTAYDTLTGDQARLGPDGQAFTVRLDDERLTDILRLAVGHGERLGVTIAVDAVFPATLFDAVDFATDSDAAMVDHVRRQLLEDSALNTALSRFD